MRDVRYCPEHDGQELVPGNFELYCPENGGHTVTYVISGASDDDWAAAREAATLADAWTFLRDLAEPA